MAKLIIDFDDEILRRIEDAAARENCSVSDWVKGRLLQSLEDQWPSGYFDLFGALGHTDLQRPPQTDFSVGGPQESL